MRCPRGGLSAARLRVRPDGAVAQADAAVELRRGHVALQLHPAQVRRGAVGKWRGGEARGRVRASVSASCTRSQSGELTGCAQWHAKRAARAARRPLPLTCARPQCRWRCCARGSGASRRGPPRRAARRSPGRGGDGARRVDWWDRRTGLRAWRPVHCTQAVCCTHAPTQRAGPCTHRHHVGQLAVVQHQARPCALAGWHRQSAAQAGGASGSRRRELGIRHAPSQTHGMRAPGLLVMRLLRSCLRAPEGRRRAAIADLPARRDGAAPTQWRRAGGTPRSAGSRSPAP